MRFLVTRRLMAGGGGVVVVPIGTEADEDGARRAIGADAAAVNQLFDRRVDNPDGPDAKVKDVLNALGLDGVSWGVVALDEDELVQLAGSAEVRNLAMRGKLSH